MEAAPGFEPGMRALQAPALPLGYAASRSPRIHRVPRGEPMGSKRRGPPGSPLQTPGQIAPKAAVRSSGIECITPPMRRRGPCEVSSMACSSCGLGRVAEARRQTASGFEVALDPSQSSAPSRAEGAQRWPARAPRGSRRTDRRSRPVLGVEVAHEEGGLLDLDLAAEAPELHHVDLTPRPAGSARERSKAARRRRFSTGMPSWVQRPVVVEHQAEGTQRRGAGRSGHLGLRERLRLGRCRRRLDA